MITGFDTEEYLAVQRNADGKSLRKLARGEHEAPIEVTLNPRSGMPYRLHFLIKTLPAVVTWGKTPPKRKKKLTRKKNMLKGAK